MLILKIFRAPEWAALRANGESQGAPIDVADGYVHFSTPTQAQETAAKHFAGEEGLVLLAVDAEAVDSIAALGMDAVVTDTIMSTPEIAANLAAVTLGAARTAVD